MQQCFGFGISGHSESLVVHPSLRTLKNQPFASQVLVLEQELEQGLVLALVLVFLLTQMGSLE